MIYETVGLLIKYEKSDSLIKESVALFINICAIRFIIYESVEPFIEMTPGRTYNSHNILLYTVKSMKLFSVSQFVRLKTVS